MLQNTVNYNQQGGVIRLGSTVDCIASPTCGPAEYLKGQANLSL